MATENEIKKMLELVKARSNPLKVKLIQLLLIYGELSTTELMELTGKSKPTILKHLEDLRELNQVKYRKETSPGAFDKRIYSVVNLGWSIKGQELRERARDEPELGLLYANHILSDLLLLKETVDSMVEYQKRLIEEVKKAVDNKDGDEMVDLMMDHLGQRVFKYRTRTQLLQGYLEAENDPQMRLHLQDLLSEVDPEGEPRGYLNLSLTIPLRRIIEQLARKDWIKDGKLWI